MTYLNHSSTTRRVATPAQIEAQTRDTNDIDAQASARAKQVNGFVQDHFINGGKLGISLAVAATRIAHGFAQANTEILTARMPEIQHHLAALPTALRTAIISGGDAETRAILRSQLVELSNDASLATRTGALWGLTGLAYATLPLTVATGYAVGAALGEERANRLVTEALDKRNASFPEATQVD